MLARDGLREVVELAAVRVGLRDVEVLAAAGADHELDARGDAEPGIAHVQDAVRADDLELAAIGEVERTVEMGEDIVLVPSVATRRRSTPDGALTCCAVTLTGSPASMRAALMQ